MRRALVLLVALAAAVPATAGEIRIEVRPDGRKVMVNEPGEARSRRLATRLLSVPDGDLLARIEEHSSRTELDPKLVQAVIQIESGYNPRALSRKGAMGLMQLMPGTARDLAVDDPWDPEQNVRGGTTYLRRLLDRFGHAHGGRGEQPVEAPAAIADEPPHHLRALDPAFVQRPVEIARARVRPV